MRGSFDLGAAVTLVAIGFVGVLLCLLVALGLSIVHALQVG